jgi:fluoride ion exporter CrcB/FEX
VLVSGDAAGARFDRVVQSQESGLGDLVLGALFVYEMIKASEFKAERDPQLRAKMIKLSIASGVLCSHTAFVGFSNEVFRVPRPQLRLVSACSLPSMMCSGAAAPMMCYGAAPYELLDVDAAPYELMDVDAAPVRPDKDARFRPAPPPSGNENPLIALLDLQGIDGSWTDPQAVQAAASVKVDCPSEFSGRIAIFATALAIAILRKRFQEKESQWRLIERKGLRWLSAQGVDAEGVISGLFALL